MTSTSTAKTTSIVKRTTLAIAALLGLAGAAQHDALAQTARPPINQPSGSHLAPGQGTVVIGPAATITSTVHYQAQLNLTCGGPVGVATCAGHFPKPGAKRQINITRIACFFEANAGTTFRFGAIDLIDSTGAVVLGETVPVDASAPNFGGGMLFTLNRAVDLQIAANQHVRPHLDVTGGTVIDASCTATGTSSTLG